MRGSLTVITGPMFAGKTTELLDLYERYGGALFKPKFDVRYSMDDVVSHDGVCHKAFAISSISDIAEVNETEKPYFVDEVQFLDGDRYDGDFLEDVKLLLSHGVNFYVSGLDMDWQGNPFPVTAGLMGMADRVVKVTAYCGECGEPAGKTFKRVQDDKAVELGADDLYDARCNIHWDF